MAKKSPFASLRPAPLAHSANDLAVDGLAQPAIDLQRADHLFLLLLRVAWADCLHAYHLFLRPTAVSDAFPHAHEGERPERTMPINGLLS